MSSAWRLAARRAIQNAIASLPPDPCPSEIKKAIDQAYPFEEREYHPYKIWLDERRTAFEELGIKKPKPKKPQNKKPRKKIEIIPPGQLNLFDHENII